MKHLPAVLVLLVVAFVLLGCDGETEKPAPKPKPPVPMTETARNVVYATPDNQPLHMDIYPARDQSKHAPVIIWLHGGGWAFGNKAKVPIGWLVEHGYTVVSANYRLSGAKPWPAQIHDCKAMVRFLRANALAYNLDIRHIAVAGHSSGAHLAALMGISSGVKELEGDLGNLDQSSSVAAAIDQSGITDLMAWHKTGSAIASNAADSLLSKFLGGPVRGRPEIASAASPVTYVNKDNPPLMILHGEGDATVNVSQGDLLANKLKAAGVDVEYIRVPNTGHCFDLTPFKSRILVFLDKHMK